MKKFIGAIIILSILFFTYNVYEDEKAIRNAKIEITDASIQDINFQYVTIKISLKIINNESRKIELEGKFEIYILNLSFGYAKLNKINVPKHSYYETEFPIKIRYADLAKGILNAIKEGNFNVYIKGKINGKIFFGLITYSQNIEARWK